MQFNKFTSIFALAFLVGVTAALPNPEPAKADYVTCPGTGRYATRMDFIVVGLVRTGNPARRSAFFARRF
ncbi:hypothetical protein BDQ17DRAFT_1549463 [Cyathus striatus]|nr:hypothetical protein BDQ17DRAFT_1549463 [Cyathus striatus]